MTTTLDSRGMSPQPAAAANPSVAVMSPADVGSAAALITRIAHVRPLRSRGAE